MNAMDRTGFRFAKLMSKKSLMREKVGACLVVGKSFITGYNKNKTHTKYANPNLHDRLSVHAELDCLRKAGESFLVHGDMYVYREVHGKPAMARPCEHCLSFLKNTGVDVVYYSIPDYPFWQREEI